MNRTAKHGVRNLLSTGQQAAWQVLVGEVPQGVTTVEELQQWVQARKVQWTTDPPAEGEDALNDRLARLDTLLAWSAGTDLPDPAKENAHEPRARQEDGESGGPVPDRSALEREWLACVVRGEGEGARAREVRALLAQRSSPSDDTQV